MDELLGSSGFSALGRTVFLTASERFLVGFLYGGAHVFGNVWIAPENVRVFAGADFAPRNVRRVNLFAKTGS